MPTDYDPRFYVSRIDIANALGTRHDDDLCGVALGMRKQITAKDGEIRDLRHEIEILRVTSAHTKRQAEEQGASARRATAAILAYRGLEVRDADPERVVGDFLRQITLEAETRQEQRRKDREHQEAMEAELLAQARAIQIVEAERDQARALAASFVPAQERRRVELEQARAEVVALRAERDRLDAELEQYADEADRLEQEAEKLLIENSNLKKLLGARRG